MYLSPLHLAKICFRQFILLASNSRRILFQEESPENLSHPHVPACSQVSAIPRGVASSFGGESRCRQTRIPLFSNGETYRWSVQNYPHSDSDYYRCPRRVQGWGTCLCHPIDTLPLRQADTLSGISSFSNHFVSHFSERKTLFPRTLIPDMTSRKYHEQRNG